MINLIKRSIVPPVGRYIINAISSSLKMRIVGYENYQYLKEMGKKCVIVFWHGQQFYPIYHFRNNKIAIMVSLSNDGEIQNKILSSFGYEVVRGSSSRGAVSGLIGLIRKMREGSDVALALDGPRGPYQTAKEGVNYIAIKEDCCVLPIACAFKSFKQFGAWDKYMLPYPYSSGIMLVGRPIMPNKLNIAAMTHKHLEKILISMTAEAETMLAAGDEKIPQVNESRPENAAVNFPDAEEEIYPLEETLSDEPEQTVKAAEPAPEEKTASAPKPEDARRFGINLDLIDGGPKKNAAVKNPDDGIKESQSEKVDKLEENDENEIQTVRKNEK
ncbi:MAG TPA: lysophospholipid acyltransferase family protein [Candidatus Wallbacteria bacterium]|nr:lysophospholipid acyltransferase family protein [Candidatus Wallbacteria bacterium]